MLWKALGRLQPVLMLLVLALFVALALDAPVRWRQGRGMRRGAGILVVALALGALLLLTLRSIVPVLADQVVLLVQSGPALVARLSEAEWLVRADERFGLRGAGVRTLEGLPGAVTRSVMGLLTSAVALAIGGFTVVILVVFMLLFGGPLVTQSLCFLEEGRQRRALEVLGRMREAVSGYLAGAFIQVAIGAAFTALFTWALGVPFYLALGLSYLIFGFIPYAGSTLVGLLVSFSTLAAGGLKRALIALGIFLVYQQLECSVLQPFIQRRTIKMNPLLISVVVLVGAGVWGILGAVVSIPVAAAIQVTLRELQRKEGPGPARSTKPGPARDAMGSDAEARV